MTKPTPSAETEQTALEAMLDALVAIVTAEATELADLPEPAVVVPFPTVL